MADPFLGYAGLLTGDHLKGPPFAWLNLLRTKNLLPSLELRQGPDLHSNPMALCFPPPTHSSLSLTNVFLKSFIHLIAGWHPSLGLSRLALSWQWLLQGSESTYKHFTASHMTSANSFS